MIWMIAVGMKPMVNGGEHRRNSEAAASLSRCGRQGWGYCGCVRSAPFPRFSRPLSLSKLAVATLIHALLVLTDIIDGPDLALSSLNLRRCKHIFALLSKHITNIEAYLTLNCRHLTIII